MTLVYRFKKERLQNGAYVSRPRILVELSGSNGSIVIPALIDSGSDITIIPEGIAKAINLNMKGKKDKLYAYRESADVIQSTASITFLGKEYRQSVTLNNTTVLIALAKEGIKEEEDIVLGIEGIFDAFEIIFKKSENKIVFKTSSKSQTYKRLLHINY